MLYCADPEGCKMYYTGPEKKKDVIKDLYYTNPKEMISMIVVCLETCTGPEKDSIKKLQPWKVYWPWKKNPVYIHSILSTHILYALPFLCYTVEALRNDGRLKPNQSRCHIIYHLLSFPRRLSRSCCSHRAVLDLRMRNKSAVNMHTARPSTSMRI